MLRHIFVCFLSASAAFSAISITSPASPYRLTYKQGTAVPAAVPVNVQSSGTSFAATIASEQAGWLDVNPKQGAGNTTVSLSFDPRNLAVGEYVGLITFSETSPEAVTSTLRVEITVTPATAVPTPINPLALGYIAHIAEGSSWRTALTVVNLQDVQQRLTVKFWSDAGRELLLPITGVGTFSGVYFDLAPNGSGTLETAGTSASLVTGWISIEGPANGFGAMAVFRSVGSGRPDTEATSPMRFTPAKKSVIPFDNRNGFATGLALANFDSKPNSPALIFRDGEGKQVLSTTVPMLAGEHTSFSLADKFPSLAGGVGTLEISSDGVTALGLRFNPSGSFTSIQSMDRVP